MRLTEMRHRLADLVERAAVGARGHTAVAILVGALAAQQLTVALSSDESVPNAPGARFGADGGSPRFLEMPHVVPDAIAADRSLRRRPVGASKERTVADTPPAIHGIPSTVLTAYRKTSERMRREDRDCGVSMPLLAAIGRVESNHASGGNVDSSGRTRTPIIGMQLNGGPGVATIRDTDGGRYDGDTSYDRAVGPMQFIPSTWARWAADGNGDGVSDPHNVHDATLAAGRYLCAAGGDLTTADGLRRAVLAYNHSEQYLRIVLSWMDVYAGGATAIPNGESGFVRVARSSDASTNRSTTNDADGRTGGDTSQPPSESDQPGDRQRPAPVADPKPQPDDDDQPREDPDDTPDVPESPIDLPDTPEVPESPSIP